MPKAIPDKGSGVKKKPKDKPRKEKIGKAEKGERKTALSTAETGAMADALAACDSRDELADKWRRYIDGLPHR